MLLRHLDLIKDYGINPNLLFSKKSDEVLAQQGDFLIRKSNSYSDMYVIDVNAFDKIYSRVVPSLEKLNEYLRSEKFERENDKKIIKLENFKIPNADQASRLQQLVFSKAHIVHNVAPSIINQPILGNYLRVVNDIEIKYAVEKMYDSQCPSVFLHRIEELPNTEVTFTVGNDNTSFSACYDIFCLQENNRVVQLKFKTFLNNPKEMHPILYQKLTEFITPKAEVKRELLEQFLPITQCAFAYLHENKQLYPEDFYLTVAKNKIISIQTPPPEVFSGNEKFSNTPSGSTSALIYRIFNNPKSNASEQNWTVITGHGDEDENEDILSGLYVRKNARSTTEKLIECKVSDLVNLIEQLGYKAGSHINILLYVCNGGFSSENRESFAKHLARCLAEKGISSTIVASKTPIRRFSGDYFEDEKRNECLRFRVQGNPGENIVVVTGTPSSSSNSVKDTIILEETGKYPNGLYITPMGIVPGKMRYEENITMVDNVSNSKPVSTASFAKFFATKSDQANCINLTSLSTSDLKTMCYLAANKNDEGELIVIFNELIARALRLIKNTDEPKFFDPNNFQFGGPGGNDVMNVLYSEPFFSRFFKGEHQRYLKIFQDKVAEHRNNLTSDPTHPSKKFKK